MDGFGQLYRNIPEDKLSGRGATPELAYADMLEKTADKLADLYGFVDFVDFIKPEEE